MKKIKYLFVILQIVLVALNCKAQYVLQPAFPDLQDFAYPVELVNANDGTNRLFLVQQRGKIYVFDNSPTVNTKKTFIDLTTKVSDDPSHGLFGLTFHPNYEKNRYFYVHYVFDSAGFVSNKWLRVSRYETSSLNPNTALLNTELTLITAPLIGGQYHCGGKIAFGRDGYLYLTFGDGPSHPSPAQDRTNLLGKIMRIDVDSKSKGRNYSIPPTNPFYENIQGYSEEIYAYGFRNLWKFSFDAATNLLWGGDVGQSSFEEIDLIENGKNYGWDGMEGFHCFPTNSCDTTDKGFTRPIFEYSHDIGEAIIGGYVYRGALHPDLFGKYIYGDLVVGKIWALTYDGINPPVNVQLLDTNFDFVSFGEDESKEIYVCTYSDTAGKIYKLKNNGLTLNLKVAIEGFYNVPENRLNISDTLNVYLRSCISPYSIVDSSKTIIDAVSFSGLCYFKNAPDGKYYLALKHRNALETWSRNGGENLRKGGLNNYDFTNEISMAFGNNLIFKGNKYCIFSGDIDKEGSVSLNDFLLIYNDAINFLSGYLKTDLNGDSFVDITDMVVAFNNSTDFVNIIVP